MAERRMAGFKQALNRWMMAEQADAVTIFEEAGDM